MNSGPVEEAGKTARSMIEILKDQPAVLALTVVLIGLLVFCFYALAQAASFRNTMLVQQADYQKYVTEILSRCIVPKGGADFRVQSEESTIVPLPPLRPLELGR
jgi:hypothetical protein